MELSDFINNKPILRTKRLILRELQVKDVPDLKEFLCDKSIYKYWGKKAGKCDLNPKLLFEKTKKSTMSFHWGIVYKKENKLIGELWVYLIENKRMAKVAFRLSSKYQGRALMSEALKEVVTFCFENTELKRLWTDVHCLNIASYKTLEKSGFLREGLIKDGKLVNTYCDYYIYGITKEAFLNHTLPSN